MLSNPDLLRLDPAIAERVQRLAVVRRQPADLLLTEAVQQYVEREERRERLRGDAEAAWAHFQATGLHVTAEEADGWLAQLEAGDEAEPPQCHV